MAFLMPAALQKRLVRYVLSQLSFLDMGSFDLDRLEGAWGRRTTGEIKQVPFKIDKLTELLKLPAWVKIKQADVDSLKLSVPLNIWREGIEIIIDGVDIRCGIEEDRQKEKGLQRGVKSNQPRDPRQANHDPGGNDADGGDSAPSGLPSIEEMAQSFVAHQSEDEKERLRSELANNSNLEDSQSSLDDEELEGLGTQFSLPAVMADFLWGIGERLRVTVRNVRFEVECGITIPSSNPSPAEQSDIVSFRLTVDAIDLKGVQAIGGKVPEGQLGADMGNHQLAVTNIQGFVVAEPALFSAFSAMSVPPSPTATHVSVSRDASSVDARSVPGFDQSGDDSLSQSMPNMSESQELAMSSSTILDADPEMFRSMYHDYSTGATVQPDTSEDRQASMIDSQYHGFGSEAGISQFDDYSSPDQSFLEDDQMDSPENSHSALQESQTLPASSSRWRDAGRSNLAESTNVAAAVGSSASQASSRAPPPSQLLQRFQEHHVEGNDFDQEKTPEQSVHLAESAMNQSIFHDFPSPLEEKDDPMQESRLFHESRSRAGSGSSVETGAVTSAEEQETQGQRQQPITDGPDDSVTDETSQSQHADSPATDADGADLTQSMLFSDQNASVYANALGGETVAESAELHVPGGWGSESIIGGIDETSSSMRASTFGHQRNDSNATIHGTLSQYQSTIAATNASDASDPDATTEFKNQEEGTAHASSSTLGESRTALRKRLFCIEEIQLAIPVSLFKSYDASTGPVAAATTMGAKPSSRTNKMPGGMSLYDDTLSRLERSTMRASLTASRQDSFNNDTIDHENYISIVITGIKLENDICLTKLLIVAVQQLLASKGAGPGSTAPTEQPLEVARPMAPAWSVKIEDFTWALVDCMPTSLDASVQPDQQAGLKTGVYFVTRMRNVTVAHKPQTVGSLFSISIAMYTFGYNDDTILRFESFVPGRERSSQWSTNVSIEILTSVGSAPHVKVKTAPLRVTVDLRRLDEAFGWFGGLSGVIGLSNSVMSTTTIIEQKKPPRPVRVRFEAPGNPPRLENQVSDPDATKITVAVNGIFVDLLGQTSSVHLKTSPMKLIVRPEGIAMQVNKLEFEGPVVYDSQDTVPVQASFGPLRMQYNQTPNEQNLGTLLGLLSPSTQRQEEVDDDVLIETLLQQRRKGGVLRVTVDSVDAHVERLHELEELTALADELKKLSTVTKYLPEDDRPGVMILVTIVKVGANIDVNPRVGKLSIAIDNLEVVCVAMPLLFLAGVDAIQARRDDETLVSQVVPHRVRQMRGNVLETSSSTPPMLVVKFVGNELEPTIKIRLCNFCAEYHVTTLMAIMGITETASGEVVIAEMIHSVANLAETTTLPSLSPRPTELDPRSASSKPMKLDVRLKDCAFGLNPRKSFAKGLLVFTNTNLSATLPISDSSALDAVAHLRKVSFLVVDDMRTLRGLQESPVHGLTVPPVYGGQMAALIRAGYVSTTDLSEAEISIQVSAKDKAGERTLDIEVLDKLLVLDSCADSTQTMGAIFAGLSPPMPPSSELKYRTEVVPVEDMLGSIVGEMEISEDEARRITRADDMSSSASESSGLYDFAKRLGYAVPDVGIHDIEDVDEKKSKPKKRVGLNFDENFFTRNNPATVWGGTALEFNSTSNEYERATQAKIAQSPLRLRVKDVNVIWNLFDGYDWQHTRNVIGEAVADVEKKAAARRAHRRHSSESDNHADEESVIGDFLFNSVYIGVGPRDDPRDLARQVNRFIADDELETASYATPTTVISNTTAARGHLRKTRRKHLRLERSKHQKITFDLKGVSADVVIFPPGSGETQTSLVLRIHELEIFDHIRTSTWKKFATYMHDFGPRDVSTPMLTIELLNVKPVPDLPASELVLRVNVLPLRLHVDQDAIDFLTRFFEFKDTGREGASAPATPGEEPFIQRFEIFAIPVKLDFKPKRVDYGGLRSGKTTEFMNFIILDGSDMVMDHIIMYGVSGFERLGKMLNDIWMPAIKQNQLPGVLAGLAPVRGIVNVGSGVKDLVMVPWQEYRKDGRLFRAMQKGAFAFARNTTTELTRLGARVALGTQAVLQNAEGLLVGQAGANDETANVRNTPGADEDVPQQISPYADQPLGVMAGLRGAYRHLERDMLHARDAVIAMPGEVRDSGSATGAARAVLKGAPTVVLRPAMGVTRALGTAFMGATNALDKDERRRADDKYKRPR